MRDEALGMFFVDSLGVCLVVESDSSNAIGWVFSSSSTPPRFKFLFNEIEALSSLISVKFKHIRQAGNGFTYSLAKQGIYISPFCTFFFIQARPL